MDPENPETLQETEENSIIENLESENLDELKQNGHSTTKKNDLNGHSQAFTEKEATELPEDFPEELKGTNVFEYVMKIMEEDEDPGVLFDEDGEMYLDEEMSMEEMRAKLPEYYFKTPKQKKKYFKKLTNSYKKKLRKSPRKKSGEIKKQIGFDLNRNQKKVFAKDEKLQ